MRCASCGWIVHGLVAIGSTLAFNQGLGVINFPAAPAVILVGMDISSESTTSSAGRIDHYRARHFSGRGSVARMMQRSREIKIFRRTVEDDNSSASLLLGRCVCADDVFHLIRVRIKESECRRPEPDPITGLGPDSVHDRHDLSFEFQHLLKTLLHMANVLRVEEIKAYLAQQFRRGISKQIKNSLVDERKFSIRRMA